MKSIVKATSIMLAIGLLFPISVLGQTDGPTSTQQVNMTVNGSSLIKVMGGPVSLSLGGATEAGASVTGKSVNTDTRLRISSLLEGASLNKITANVQGGTVMDGSNTELYLRLLPPTGTGADNFANIDLGGTYVFGTTGNADDQNLGNEETPVKCQLIGNTPINLISDIGTCWSGTGAGDGYVIEYTYKTTGAGTPQNRSVTILFTIAQQ